MLDYFLAPGLILLVLVGWIAVQRLALRFAERHPELGAARREGEGCGTSCSCKASGTCQRSH